MFIGHYGPAVFDTQRGSGVPIISLWQGFIAVQAIDIVWAILTIFGIEGGGDIVNGQPIFELPWSHTLVSSIILAFICGGIFKLLKPSVGRRGFGLSRGWSFRIGSWTLSSTVLICRYFLAAMLCSASVCGIFHMLPSY